MRLSLGGGVPLPDVILTLPAGNFDKSPYVAQGYTHFDVICIGAAGGGGGSMKYVGVPSRCAEGGAGGGGGVHRVQGLLSALPTLTPVVVGAAGAEASDTSSASPGGLLAGGDGGYSSFNGTLCRASGGKGGLPVTSGTQTDPGGIGGAGGIGNSATAGGGAAAGLDGTWDGVIGSGGGGGDGGAGNFIGLVTLIAAEVGGDGADGPSDTSMRSPGGAVGAQFTTGVPGIVPGRGGGARATVLNGLATSFGCADPGAIAAGLVIVRLSVGA